MSNSLETLSIQNPLQMLAISQEESRSRIVQLDKSQSMIYRFWNKWQALGEQAVRGDKLVLPGYTELQKIIPDMWTRSFTSGHEHSLFGLSARNSFFWSDIIEGTQSSATVDAIPYKGKIVSSTPPQMFDYFRKTTFPSDAGIPHTVQVVIHSHSPIGTNFFSQVECPGFQNSVLAREGGIFGLVSLFNVFMAKGSADGKSIRLYSLNRNGTFGFVVEKEAGNLLFDLYDDFVSLNDRQLMKKIVGETVGKNLNP